MREHHLYVMTLEEFPANREFVGRNFNAGEVIQLVLKSPTSGRWLPFEYVQMVMMHELAHCKQMNHSRAFWAVRNSYAASMRVLWGKGYTGDGLWGRGKGLSTGIWEKNTVREDEVLPEHTCGGTFRSRGRKRGRKPVMSYQERKQRRIEKKFGKNGVSLGADENTKTKLEKGKKVKGKPRVAGSARGRELRAAAALARFETQKVEEKTTVKSEDETDSGSDYEDADLPDLDSKDAIDFNGQRLVDDKGRGMVKVCEDEEGDDPDAKDEMAELRDVLARVKPDPEDEPRVLSDIPEAISNQGTHGGKTDPEDAFEEWAKSDEPHVKGEHGKSTSTMDKIPRAPPNVSRPQVLGVDESTASEASDRASPQRSPQGIPASASATRPCRLLNDDESTASEISDAEKSTRLQGKPRAETPPATGTELPCSMCSFVNPKTAVTCNMCANVLKPNNMKGAWKCTGTDCGKTSYWNAQDCGICGLCGIRREEAA